MNTQNRIYITISPRTRKALELCATLDGSPPASYASNLLWSAISLEIEKSSALRERWMEMEREALEKGSWEATQPSLMDKLEEEFTPQARKAFAVARGEAMHFNHKYVNPEHLLLGLIYDHNAGAVLILLKLGIEPNDLHQKVKSQLKHSNYKNINGVELTQQVQSMIKFAADETRSRARHAIGTEYLLLGLVREGESPAAQILNNLGVTLNAVRTCIIEMLRQEELQTNGE